MIRSPPENKVDRISRLSDELLCHILSFLSTEEAVSTSVLSKRWKPLWTSVPVLDYDDQIYLRNNKPASCFERFVYATILARNARQPIRKFRLKYGVCGSELSDADAIFDRSNADINVWVNTAITRGIENLEIEISPTNYHFSLNCCSLSCKTLVVLKLKGLSLNVSSSVDLPSLKSLHMEAVRFVEPKYLIEILHGCPMLEGLKIRYVDYAHEEYDGSVVNKEGFKNLHLPKLVRADLRFVGMDVTDILLKAIANNVEILRINQYGAVSVVPEFPHVRHLGLFLVSHNWHSVLLMLKNCPNLQSFKLYLNRSCEAEDVLPYPHFVVPECLISRLTKCYLKHYRGTQSDLQFAKHIMKNSTSLQSMKIRSASSNPHVLLKELALCSRKSELCELSFN